LIKILYKRSSFCSKNGGLLSVFVCIDFYIIGRGEKVKKLLDISFDNNHYRKLFFGFWVSEFRENPHRLGFVVGKWVCKLIYTVLAAFFDLYNNRRTRKTRFLGKMELIMKITEKKIENVSEIETLISERSAAAMLSVSFEVLRKRLRPQNKIAYLRIGNSIRYSVEDVKIYLAKCRIEAEN
jgi:hypothetical protein